ncbi:Crp/Fnr family transcriptional regulator [Colwellia sp. D2M02]|uniref:Crp/Fnr family transcriptional regulator n=1 Tax=Colwellia asteriadis TaxID=517723 RepID=A0ABN1L6U3_9GAMM|nr:Crp/Fnr family transcriptional regulator [Colwellia sp. D2M02]MBU2892353.1 Crp/Fnr family transcriptional regulator [Colwellia sp. D2M02]
MTESLSRILLENGVIPASIPKVTPLFRQAYICSGTVVLSPGQHWNELMAIRQGIFRLYYLDSSGKESNKGFFSENQILAPIARSAIQEPSLFFVEALTNVEVYSCNYEQLATILNKSPSGRNFYNRLAENLLEDKIRREIMFLQLDAKGRYERFFTDFPDLHERVPLHHLASYLGMTDVTLSRIRRKTDLSNVKELI